jgi:hypothetical protein
VFQRQRLLDECLNVLSDYVSQAQRTCELLRNVEGDSLSLDRLLAIVASTQAEDELQSSYMLLRQRLFGLLISNRREPEPVREGNYAQTREQGLR